MIIAMGRPSTTRRLRRWARTTPNAQIGMTMLGIGAVCLLVALLIVGIDAHWM